MIFQLEICAFSIGSCTIAEQSGAHRIELCDNPSDGGTTPSFGLIQAAREKLHIDIFPIIRPRGGDFFYSEDDYGVMRRDVKICKNLGCNGVVVGMLNNDGSIDKKRTAKLVEIAYPMGVTFHRAFDRTSDPFKSMEDIIDIGCERILTSGQQPTAMEGMPLLKALIEHAAERIIIMPGSGIRAKNVSEVAIQTGALEFHTTARKLLSSKMNYINKNMNESLEQTICDGKEVLRIINELKKI
ncbi:MAG: copper homeostasis protein CutC [Chitinophagaceae bacterium]